ncbi:type I-MYXAN CRISPR-associated Cas8a1/Cmx1 [Polyangium jinanense]|uniref:type I-MYXAN CRISPR-associated Cas8a1/Cmx1 n=1 Tax=Polyangium jinanense TaxID=2829994 RepID=UPI002341965C|nr:type I-MYXAN CRISPR-associated Cas8a1/Cmx1 [Polyangium jinanense]MDC3952629.1 type I-MYXAN CRISPR-associated Cas8a1/Cmx1 [Polyangium jinanense]
MAREMIYRLTDPGYTIYHRAALGGLAATVEAWGKKGPEGIRASVTSGEVRLGWGDELTDQEALRRILDASFRVTDDKMIELVGHRIPPSEIGLRLAIHNGLCATFLQHNKMRPSVPGEKDARRVSLRSADGETLIPFTYKGVASYAHQKAQGTGLLEYKPKKGEPLGALPRTATIPQSVVPGAMTGVAALEARAEEVFLLLYLMVGSVVFLLRNRAADARMQSCVVVPDVGDLRAFSKVMQALATLGNDAPRLTSGYLGRIVGGAEEAALRFLLDWKVTEGVVEHPGIAGCLAVAMGKVAWDKNQVNRTSSVRVGLEIPELGVFQAAVTHLGKPRMLKNQKGEGFAVPQSPVPELVAANLGAGRRWVAHFRALVEKKQDYERMRFAQGGLNKMKDAIEDEDERAVIAAFHEAWNRVMGAFGERARRDNASFERMTEVERERMRNAILRAKTADALAGWFLRFCADSTKGAALPTIKTNAERLRKFLFDPRNTDRLQNLLLFALVSYAGEGPKKTDEKG